MKVVLRLRSDVTAYPGGDYVQALETARALREWGVDCTVLPGVEPLPAGVDLVHLFNTTRIHETWLQAREARQRGIPYLLSPIWHSMEEMRRFYGWLYRVPLFPIWFYLAMKEPIYARRSGLPIYWPAFYRYRGLQQEVVRQAAALLPNSQAELTILDRELGGPLPPAFIVPHGVAPPAAPAAPGTPRRDVVCVGRLEPRKNQLAVARAFKTLPRGEHRLLFFGAINDSHAAYAAQIQAECVPGWVEYRGAVSREAIGEAFAQAQAVILASFFETCGLVALEGMAGGAAPCISRTPYTEEFYGADASYCDPFQPATMASALQTVLSGPTADYSSRLEKFTWPKAATETLRAYKFVLERRTERQI